jgi:tetratricopeptide (TPR) repeat protein
MERAGNNCYQCHMPKADTNVTHAAFHHHRIGIHSSEKKPIAKTQAKLVPILDLSGLTEREQIRCLSIAKVLQLREDPTNIDYDHFGHEATASLIKLRSSGPVDAASESQLARLAIAQNQEAIAVNLAQQSRTKDPRPTLAHIEATALLARIARQNGQMDKAVELYRKVASYHRDANDTFYLGICEMTLGNVAQATAAFEKSLEIDPMQVNPHRALQTIYQQTNRPKQAAVHAEAQQKIIQTMQLLQQKSSPQ